MELGQAGWSWVRWVHGLAIPILNLPINFSKSYSKKGWAGWRWVELGEGGWRWVLGLALPMLNVLINFSESYSKKGFLVAHAIKMIFNLFCFRTELLKNFFSLLARMNRIKKVSKQELQIILCFEKRICHLLFNQLQIRHLTLKIQRSWNFYFFTSRIQPSYWQ